MGTLISTVIFAAFAAGAYCAGDDKVVEVKPGELTKQNKLLLGAAVCFVFGYIAGGNRR